MQPLYFKETTHCLDNTTISIQRITENTETVVYRVNGADGNFISTGCDIHHLQRSFDITQSKYVQQHLDLIENAKRENRPLSLKEIDKKEFDRLVSEWNQLAKEF